MRSRGCLGFFAYGLGLAVGCSDSQGPAPTDALDAVSGMAGSSSDASPSNEATGSADVGTGSGGSASSEAMPLGDAAISADTGASNDVALPDRLILATGQSSPTGITVDDTYVYFANRDDGTIVRCPHAGCGTSGAKTLVTGQDKPIALAHDATDLYWVTGWHMGETGAPPSRPVFRCALPECASATIEPFDRGTYQPYAIGLSGDKVFLAAWPMLGVCAKTGCTGTSSTIGTGPYVSVDPVATTLYLAKYGFGRIVSCPLPGCSPETPILDTIRPMSVVADTANLYVADFDFLHFFAGTVDAGVAPRILRCPLTGCTGAGLPDVVESSDITPYALAEHGDRLYFTNVQQGTVISRRK